MIRDPSLRLCFTEQPPRDDWFILGVGTMGPEFDRRRFETEAARAVDGRPAHCLFGRGLAVALAAGPSMRVVLSPDGRRLAAVYGEVHGRPAFAEESSPIPAGDIDAEYARNLNGSWALFHFDADRDEVVVVTDRLNSRRVFHSCDGQTRWFSSGLGRHPRRGGAIDAVAVGWYLTHGAMYGNRTPFEAIRTLPPSSLHRIRPHGTTTERYWLPTFSEPQSSSADARRLQADFGDLLVDAVRCRVAGADPLCVSLSAGYDAAGIAGILGERLRQPDVRCFSYARGPAKEGSDERISAETARRLGYSHEVLTSYVGDYPSWLEANARASNAMAGLCDEVDAWAALAKQMTGLTATILVGDECLGWTDYALGQPADALRAAQIQGGPHLDSARRVLSPDACATAIEGIESDIRAMLSEAPRFADLHDLKDYFYTSQRAPNYILPWRQSFASRVGNVRFPLLDTRVLDFMATVPAPLRRQKALYRRTIRSLCPITFSLPRATSASYHVDHSAEFATAGSSLFPLQSPSLAAMTSPHLQAVVDQASRDTGGRHRRRSVYKMLIDAIKHTPIGDLLRKAQPAPPVRNPSTAELLARLLCLDRSLVAMGSP